VEITAYYAPSLAILVTGDEVVESGARPGPYEIRDTNSKMLTVMARSARIWNLVIYYVHDTAQALAHGLKIAEDNDVVVLTGGVSAGNYDLVPKALEAYGASVVFHKVAQQPGKPLLFAVKGRRLFFALPGTPLGCHLGFFRYVTPALRVLAGRTPGHAQGHGVLAAAWSTKSDRQQFVLARVETAGGESSVTLLAPKGSSDLFSVWSANAYVTVPEGTKSLEMGADVAFEWLAPSLGELQG
jgi:molybdopterin molybdotransferase